jgi:hypothetical protein
MFRKNEDQLAASTIDRFLRLAKAPPDEALLRRYFFACAGKEIPSPLTAAEHRWVTVNLDANPSWQQKWKELEAGYGSPVNWRLHARFPEPAIKSKSSHRRRWWAEFLEIFQPQPAFRFAAAAALVCAILYGTLWLGGRLMLPQTYALASVDAHKDDLRVKVRGGSSAATREFSAGAAALVAAPRHWLGLFSHYDPARVDTALAHFHRAFDAANDPFQRAEIAFFLAKAYLMKDDAGHAKPWLEQTLAQNVAEYRDEAKALLEKLADADLR